ncbi:MAG: hypothetical protein AAFV53_14375 [Myxococcota bacterium]
MKKPGPSGSPAPILASGGDPAPRFSDTQSLLAYGVKLGVAKAAQEQAINQLKKRFPDQAEMLDNPAFLAGMKMALPLIGIQLAQQLRNEQVSAQVRDASQGMLLINTIDTTADVAGHLADQFVEMGSFLLGLYGIDPETAKDSARQIVEDFGVDLDTFSRTAAPADQAGND